MSNIRVGRPDIHPDYTAHVPGVRQGNHTGNYKHECGHMADGRSTARRSTGINPKGHEPVLPEMPNLSPA